MAYLYSHSNTTQFKYFSNKIVIKADDSVSNKTPQSLYQHKTIIRRTEKNKANLEKFQVLLQLYSLFLLGFLARHNLF